MELKRTNGDVIFTYEDIDSFINNIQNNKANLTKANLEDADLTKANLAGANLTKAILTRANLTRAGLEWATLKGADFTGTNLAGANLTGADLEDANFKEANWDFTSLQFRCNTFGFKASKDFFFQVFYHLCRIECDDAKIKELQQILKPFANQAKIIERHNLPIINKDLI